jgi:peroxiredoxin
MASSPSPPAEWGPGGEVTRAGLVDVRANVMAKVPGVLVLFSLISLTAGCARAPALPSAEPPTWERPGLRGAVRPEMGSPQPGEAAPDFDLPALAGGTVRLSSLRGSWVVVHFTASWCPYCDAEVAHLGEMASAYAGRNVKVVIVDLQEEEALWRAYARERVAPGLIALQDRDGSAARRLSPPRAQLSFTDRAQVLFDSTLVVDPAGTLRLFLLPDTAHFDPTFRGVRGELDRWAPAAAAPREGDVLAPDKVVSVDGDTSSGDALEVRLQIAPGYHIMSDRPSDEFSIPTRVRATVDGTGCELGAPAFPSPALLDVGGKPLSTFAGAVQVRLPLRCQAPAPNAAKPIAVEVRYQACTASRCLPPVTKKLEVAPPRPL